MPIRLLTTLLICALVGCTSGDDTGEEACDVDPGGPIRTGPSLSPAMRGATTLGLAGANDITNRTGENPTVSTWDGKVIVRRCPDPAYEGVFAEEPTEGQPGVLLGQYWCFHAFRPGRVTLDAAGVPQFDEAFGPGFTSDTRHVSHTGGFPIVENTEPEARWNPYPSDALGVACGAASLEPTPPQCPQQRYATYDAYIVHSVVGNNPTMFVDYPDYPVGAGIPTYFEPMRVVVQDPETDAATVVDVIRDGTPYPMVVDTDGFGFVFGGNEAASRNPYLFEETDGDGTVYIGGPSMIEPAATLDGRLVIFNAGDEDTHGVNLVYTWNPNPAGATGWSPPKNVAYMYWVEGPGAPGGETLIDIDGELVPFSDVFPIARQPLLDHDGVPYDPGSTYQPATRVSDTYPNYHFDDEISYEHYMGSYPWVSWDGRHIMSLAVGRFNVAVIGDLTGYQQYWIDGAIDQTDNHGPNVHEISAMWTLGQWPGRWAQYAVEFEGRTRTIPTRLRDAPTWAIFEQDHYSEISFHKTDGSYALYFPMSRMRSRTGEYGSGVTPDVSGHFNNGTLVSTGDGTADFSANFSESGYEDGGGSDVFGFSGNSMGFAIEGSQPSDPPFIAAGPAPMGGALTVEAAVYLQAGPDLPAGAWTDIVRQPGAFALGVDADRRAWFEVTDADGTTSRVQTDPFVPDNTWVHLTGVYDGSEVRLYVDGVVSAVAPGMGPPVYDGATGLTVGPNHDGQVAGHGQFYIDEVGITAGVRTDDEIAHSAFQRVAWPTTPLAEWESLWGADAMPLGLADADGNLLAPLHADYGYAGDTIATVALGERLFHDTALSTTDPPISCESCHGLTEEDGGARAGEVVSEQGAGILTRHTPTVFNRVFGRRQFWDGRANGLGEQLLFPISSPVEMDMPLDDLVAQVLPANGYGADFCQAYGEDPTLEGLQAAIALYESGLVSGDSAVDRHRFLGEPLSDSAGRGLALFATKARCIGCHPPPTYTDERFHDNAQGNPEDPGRAMATGREADHGRFRTMSLRDAVRTPPYMHDGSVLDLRAVVDLYNAGGDRRHPEMKPLFLTEQEVQDVVAFLEALRSEAHVVPLR